VSVRIDAHQHFWRPERGDYGWLTPDLEGLYRDFGPHDLAPLLTRAGVARTIVVQAAPTLSETRFLLEIARATGFVAGVVGWVDLEAPDAADVLAKLAGDRLLRGVRPMIQDIPDPDWMLHPALEAPLRSLSELGLVFDALVRPAHLPNLRRLLDRHPELRVVIDHGAKPDIAAGALAPWAEHMSGLARDTSACCKLSGLMSEAGHDPSLERIRPFAEHLLAAFGPERLLWGSDWPVLTLAGDYETWWEMTQRLLEPLAGADRDRILGGTAARCYRIEEESR
jgi:L-fuconolactonase